jgi:hypothetical protein
MRDGIYKNLPLPKSWQAVLRSCMLDAERGTIAREKVERAIVRELRKIEQPFRSAFREKTELAESLLPSIRAFGDDLASRDLAGQNSPLENEIVAQGRRLEGIGLKGPELERQAYERAIKQMMERYIRSMEQTVLTSGTDSNAKATIRAARSAIESAKIMPIVDAVLAGHSLDLPPARRPVDLDEDLSRIFHD